MRNHNGATRAMEHPFESQVDALEEEARKFVNRITTASAGWKSRAQRFATKTNELIKEHPVAAGTIAFAVGYVLARVARR